MPTAANAALINALERQQLLTAIQIEEVRRGLQQRLPDPEAAQRPRAWWLAIAGVWMTFVVSAATVWWSVVTSL